MTNLSVKNKHIELYIYTLLLVVSRYDDTHWQHNWKKQP